MDQASRLAIIDLGSNTCRLVLFEFSPHLSFRLIDQVSERVRLSEGMYATNHLQPEPMARTLHLLKLFRELCRANSITRVVATASSAVRDAANREEFLQRAHADGGVELRVLSGDEEAYYAYLGAVNSLTFRDGIVADLGGGSLELTRVRERMPAATASLPLGAVHLTEQFLQRDPIPARDARALSAFVDTELQGIEWLESNAEEELVVLGGTMRALANMDQRRRRYSTDRLHGYVMPRRAVKAWAKELLGTPLEKRRKVDGLSSERVDVIPAGASVIHRLAKHLGKKSIMVSGRGLREGLFYENFLQTEASHEREGQVENSTSAAARLPLIANVRAFGIANIGYLYRIDWTHAEHVCNLALTLFDQLRARHGYGAAERELLGTAAILHDVGVVIDYYRHQYHSAYLIENTDLPGFTHREIALIALLVRWHRHGKPTLDPYASLLNEADTTRVRQLSALLRLAEDLERSRAQVVATVRARVRGQHLAINVVTRDEASAELWAAERDAEIFQEAYGLQLRVTAVPAEHVPQRMPALANENIFQRAQWLAEKFALRDINC